MLVSYNDVAKISDFGMSKEWDERSVKMSFAGTAVWMAPEVIKNQLCSDKIDVWSVVCCGVVWCGVVWCGVV